MLYKWSVGKYLDEGREIHMAFQFTMQFHQVLPKKRTWSPCPCFFSQIDYVLFTSTDKALVIGTILVDARIVIVQCMYPVTD